jgi:hypothetical protein
MAIKRLNSKGLSKINEIAKKYHFSNGFKIEQYEVIRFCNNILRCTDLGLNLDPEDEDFLTEVRDTLTEDRYGTIL